MNGLLKIALSQYGVSERSTGDNPVILNYAKESGIDGIANDEISWCSIFINWCCFKAGLQHSGSPSARSWLNVGEETKQPETGDIVVLWREAVDSWKGHVGIYINLSEDKNMVFVLGGNQGNRVCVQTFSVNMILGFRRLIPLPVAINLPITHHSSNT